LKLVQSSFLLGIMVKCSFDLLITRFALDFALVINLRTNRYLKDCVS